MAPSGGSLYALQLARAPPANTLSRCVCLRNELPEKTEANIEDEVAAASDGGGVREAEDTGGQTALAETASASAAASQPETALVSEETIGGVTTFTLPIGDKTRVFERGPAELPDQINDINYENTYKDMMGAGDRYGSAKSSPMALFGSTIGPSGDPYRYPREDGTHGMLPRLLTASRPGRLTASSAERDTRDLNYTHCPS